MLHCRFKGVDDTNIGAAIDLINETADDADNDDRINTYHAAVLFLDGTSTKLDQSAKDSAMTAKEKSVNYLN